MNVDPWMDNKGTTPSERSQTQNDPIYMAFRKSQNCTDEEHSSDHQGPGWRVEGGVTTKGQEGISEGRGDEHICILTIMMVTQICPFCQDSQDSMSQRINIAQLYFYFF